MERLDPQSVPDPQSAEFNKYKTDASFPNHHALDYGNGIKRT